MSKLKPHFCLSCTCSRFASCPHGDRPASNPPCRSWGHGGRPEELEAASWKDLGTPSGRKDLPGGIPGRFPGSALSKTFCSLQLWGAALSAQQGTCLVVLSGEAARSPLGNLGRSFLWFLNAGAYIYSIKILLDSLPSGSVLLVLCSGYLFSWWFFSEPTGEARLTPRD